MKTAPMYFSQTQRLLTMRGYLIILCALLTISESIYAHTLSETTAQVILRDGQIEVIVTTDLKRLSSALQNSEAWLLGDIETVMPTDLSIEQQEHFIKNALIKKMNLVINKQVITFDRVAFSKLSDTDHQTIVFQAQHSFSNVNELSVSFHKSLGSVYVNFIKPQYQKVTAGNAAHISC